MSDPIAGVGFPVTNYVTISGPKSGDVICGTTVVAGGTYSGVTSISVALNGSTANAKLSSNGAWRATLTGVSKGSGPLTATPNGTTPPASESNVTVEDPCTLVVNNPPTGVSASGDVINGTYNSSPISGVGPSVTADLISPPTGGLQQRTTAVCTIVPGSGSSTGTWSVPLPAASKADGYSLEVRRNDGNFPGAKLAQVTVAITIG
jgi:hypothetical protein